MNWNATRALVRALMLGAAVGAGLSLGPSTPAYSAAAAKAPIKIENKALADAINGAQADAKAGRYADALAKAAPDVALIISAEHVNKFFIDNMPAFAIGMFDAFSGPVESRTRNFGVPYRRPWRLRASDLVRHGWHDRENHID